MQTEAERQIAEPVAAGNAPKKKPLTLYLAVLAGVLAIAVGGFFYYLQQQAARFESQCHEGEQMALEIKYMLDEVKNLPGEKDNEAIQEWLVRLDTAKNNVDKLVKDLEGARPGSKYQQARGNLLAAAEMERELFEDIEAVVKEPLAGDAQDKISSIEGKTIDLHDLAMAVEIGQTDFAAAMDMSTLRDNLTAFVGNAREAERRRLEQEARIAQEKEKQRLADIQARQQSYNNSVMAKTHDMVWLATGVKYVSPQRLDLSGFFYNGTNNPVTRINTMTLSITLYRRGEVVYENDDFYFSAPIDMYGAVAPGTKKDNSLYVTSQTDFPQDFDEFRIATEDMNWTYIR